MTRPFCRGRHAAQSGLHRWPGVPISALPRPRGKSAFATVVTVFFEYLRVWAIANVAAALALAVASFAGSYYALEALAAIDQWLREAEHRYRPSPQAGGVSDFSRSTAPTPPADTEQ